MEGAEVKVWRRAERERLIALRQGLPAAQRHNWSAQIDAALRGILAKRPGILGVYWPFRAEFDPRPLVDWAVAAGRRVALPVVVDKKGPLEYRAWRPSEPRLGRRVSGAGPPRPRARVSRRLSALFRQIARGFRSR